MGSSPWGCKESDMTERLHYYYYYYYYYYKREETSTAMICF